MSEGTVTISLERYEELKKIELRFSNVQALMNRTKEHLQKYCDATDCYNATIDGTVLKNISTVLKELIKITK